MSLLVATHATAATVGLLLGGWQLLRPTKGDRWHRRAGRVWVVALVYVCLSSFWIREIAHGGLSLLHVLSVVTLVRVTLGVLSAVRGDVEAHRRHLRGSWFGLVVAFVLAVAAPDRAIPRLVVTEPLQAATAALLVVLGTAALVALVRTGGTLPAGVGRPHTITDLQSTVGRRTSPSASRVRHPHPRTGRHRHL